jgi:hypothetical protein
MNDMLFNSRGLGELAKHLHIAHCSRDYCLDFLAISEIGRRHFSTSILNRLSGWIDCLGFTSASRYVRGHFTWRKSGIHACSG